LEDDIPKFGAGSEFGRKARRKKYRIRSNTYKLESQPWILTVGKGKTAKTFKGTRTDIISGSYYILIPV